MASARKKKKRSQAPVALVYFATMLLFLAVFALIASFLIERLIPTEETTESTVETAAPSYNTLYARINSKGVLCDAALVRISLEQKRIIVTPISPYTVSETDNVSTLREVYANGGIKQFQKATAETFGVTVDYYISIDNEAFDSMSDILGGIVYTPEEELYYLSLDSDDNDVSYPAGVAASIDGKQIRLILQYPVFSEGSGGNMKFLGEVLYQFVNNAFQQVNITKNNLDNMYSVITSNSDTNYSSSDFKLHKSYITEMLDGTLEPAEKCVPEGEWTDDKHFKLSDDFKTELARLYAETEPSTGSETTSGSSGVSSVG